MIRHLCLIISGILELLLEWLLLIHHLQVTIPTSIMLLDDTIRVFMKLPIKVVLYTISFMHRPGIASNNSLLMYLLLHLLNLLQLLQLVQELLSLNLLHLL